VGGVAGGAIGNYLDKQAQELQEVSNARRTETGILVNLKSSLLFSSDSAVIKPDAVEQLARLGDILAKYPDDRIRIQGHTDSTGSAAHDEELSLRRAEAVRDVLASRGVNPRQMLVEGAGAARPIAEKENSAPACASAAVPGAAQQEVRKMKNGTLKGVAIAGALATLMAPAVAFAGKAKSAKGVQCEGTNDCKGKGNCKSASHDCK